MPNVSGRMDNLRAAILRPQIAALPENAVAWNLLYRAVEDGLRGTPGLRVIERPPEEHFVGSSIQFLLPGWPGDAIEAVVAGAGARGVELKWFGATSPRGSISVPASTRSMRSSRPRPNTATWPRLTWPGRMRLTPGL